MLQFYFIVVLLVSTASAHVDEHLSLLQKRARVKLTAQGDPAACSNPNRLIFGGTSVVRNNLGGAGDEGLEYENVFPHSGEQVNLVINAVSGYEKDPNRNNGVNNKVAKINLKTGRTARLRFTFSKTVGPFYMSFLDFDEMQSQGKAREKVTITTFDSYELTDSTLVATTVNNDGSVTFSSTTHGTGADNVADTHDMSQEQLDKTVSVLMPAVQTFEITVEAVSPPRNNNRFFQFAGITNGVCDVSPTPPPTPSPTPPPGPPTTCGNACHAGMAYKRCAFWGDPHYTKTFGAAQHFDIHGFGVKTLAKTQCGSVEVQAVQCPWWHFNNNAAVAAGFAMRVGSDVVTVVATTVANPGGISVSGGNPWTITSSDSCVSLWIRTNHQPPTPSKYYMDMELKVDDPASDGTCSGTRADFPTPQNEILFTDAQLQSLCGACRFACPGSLLSTGAGEEQPAPTAQQACEEAGIAYADALAACGPLCKETENGCDKLEDCALDFCSTDGDEAVIQEELEDLKHFDENA